MMAWYCTSSWQSHVIQDWILMEVRHVILAHTTVQCSTNLELSTVEAQQQCQQYEQHVTEVLNDENHIIHIAMTLFYRIGMTIQLIIKEFQNVIKRSQCAIAG